MIESYTNAQEEAPGLPEDPTEAAMEFEKLWTVRESWKEDEPTPWNELSEEEQLQEKARGEKFKWLAETFRSDLMWLQTQIQTNSGIVYCFRFSPQYDDVSKGEIYPPNAYVYFPNSDEKTEEGILITKIQGEWEKTDLKVLSDKYDADYM